MLRNSPTDDQSDSSASDTPSRAGEGTGTVQGLLQSIHYLFEGKNAVGKFAEIRLSTR